MFHFSRCARFVVAVVLAVALPAVFGPVAAQTRPPDVPVLVVGEDEDPRTIPRSSEIFRNVIAELKAVMSRAGFRVIDEGAVSVDLKWEIRDRRPKKDLIDLAKMLNRSGDATHGVRALVPFAIRVEDKALHAYTRIRIRMSADIYDVASNQFVDAFETEKTYSTLPDCTRRSGCITRVAGRRGREVAAIVGAALAAKLARYRDRSLQVAPSQPDVATAVKPGNSPHGIETPYTVDFHYFDRREALTIIGVMAEEFPGYKSHRLINTDQGVRKYAYLTTAGPGKIEEWLAILLADMNFDPDKDVRVAIEGTGITVEKIVATRDRPRSRDEKALFK